MNAHRLATLSLFLLLAVLVTTGCGAFELDGSGYIVTEERKVENFDRVSTCCGFDVQVTQGEEEYLRLTGDDNLLREITVYQRGDQVVVDREHSLFFNPTRRIRVEVGVKNLRAFSGSGGSRLTMTELEASTLRIELSGGGEGKLTNLSAGTLSVALSGGSELAASGTIDRQSIELSGGSDYHARDLISRDAVLDLSGGSDARVNVSDNLHVDASGGSDVYYRGVPRMTMDLSGDSDVRADR